MKQALVFVALALFCLLLSADTEAQQRSKGPKRAGTQAGSPLNRFVGGWDTSFSILRPGGMTLGTVGTTSIKKVNPRTISFSMSRREMRQRQLFPGGPVVPEFETYTYSLTLARNGQSKNYLLTLKSNEVPSIENIALTYSAEAGFTGQSEVTVGDKTVKIDVEIKWDKDGGHNWSFFDLTSEGTKAPIAFFTLSFSKKT
ncbi:MAG: hypothetical protein L0229_02105 [Blastocatellia bacterium]|nr:hypothetical protein [Blastocatellia bacterium]